MGRSDCRLDVLNQIVLELLLDGGSEAMNDFLTWYGSNKSPQHETKAELNSSLARGG